MKKLFASALLSTVSLIAAPLTVINPPPGTEGDTLAIITTTFPDFIRLSDDIDIYWGSKSGEFVIAFEDHPTGDFDFNDSIWHVVMDNGVMVNMSFVGSWSTVQQNLGFTGGLWYNQTVLGKMWSNPALNYKGKDFMVTWGKAVVPPPPPPVSDVPEPMGMVLFGTGLAIVAGLRRRR